jgi:hypothetical protein
MLRVLRRTVLAIAVAVLLASPARAEPPTDDPLPVARALFAEALRDEEAGRFADALDKFERVRAVRDTASVEYRIGSCHEGLGEPVPAYRAYLAARTLAASDPQSADIAQAASERLDALSKQVAQLAITTPPAPQPTPAPPPPSLEGASPTSPPPAKALEAPPRAPGDSLAVVGWIAVGGGAAFLTAAAVLLVARQNEIADLEDACPNGLCPAGAHESELEATRRRAEIYGPIGVTCGIAGIALVAVGVYGIASAHRPSTTSRLAVVPMVALAGAGLAFTGALP